MSARRLCDLRGGGLTWDVDSDTDADAEADAGMRTEDALVLPARLPPPRDLDVNINAIRREFLDTLSAALSGPPPELRERAPTTFAALAVWLERETCELRIDVERIMAVLG